MIEGYSPVMQAFLGTLFTWGLTACGASLVVIIRGSQRKVLDASLGFAAGVMVAASFWSLLSPAIELAGESKYYGENGEYAWAPVALGFLLGSLFVYGADVLISVLGLHSPNMMLVGKMLHTSKDQHADGNLVLQSMEEEECNIEEIERGRWKRIMLLVVAITVHNIPEGLAVGVGFAATGSSTSANFESA
ncbi:hypothetical protein D910_08911, partial [Dendroctonus ponderosae]